MSDLPSGTVTLLFTDIEGSTSLLHELGERYAEVLAEHRRVLREAFARQNGVEVDTQGDAFFVAFGYASDAVMAAKEAQGALDAGPVRVRIGIHTGEPDLGDEGYVGMDVHRGARIAAAGHGGQVLLSQATRDLLDDHVELLDLGEHRLKDLPEPEWLFQLGDEEFPPLKSLNNTNLPAAANPLIGRERELQELGELVEEENVRLLTLTGAGGTGKTRLALELAAEAVGHYPNGVFFVSLAPISDPALVLPTIAQTLGVKEQADAPILDTLAHELEPKKTLLFLDNLEQIVEAAPQLAELLGRASQLKLLVTSREPLHLVGEVEYALPPLTQTEAIELFRARAASAEPLEAVAEICRRLDGLPLALELAAARTKLLPPKKLLERLEQRLPLLTGKRRDLPARQQTLKATIAWSYDLLSAEEQELFARLSVFVGGCTLEAAEEVCDAGLETLESLLDKSLLRRREDLSGEPRYWMLETIREFAAEQFAESDGGEGVRSRHARFFETLAERAADEYFRADAGHWIARVGSDHENMRAALEWRGRVDPALQARLAGALARFWVVGGYLAEGRSWLEGALRRSPDDATSAKLVRGLVSVAGHSGDNAAAGTRAQQLLELAERLQSPALQAEALLLCGQACATSGDLPAAAAYFEEAERAARAAADHPLIADVVGARAYLAHCRGEFEEAIVLASEARARFLELGDEQGAAWATFNRADTHFHLGDFGKAAHGTAESAETFMRLGDRSLLGPAVAQLGAAVVHLDEPLRAARLLGAGERLMELTGYKAEPDVRAAIEEARAQARTAVGDEAFDLAWTEGSLLATDEALQVLIAEASQTADIH